MHVFLADLGFPLNEKMIRFYSMDAPNIITFQTITWLQENDKISKSGHVTVRQDKFWQPTSTSTTMLLFQFGNIELRRKKLKRI